MFGGKQAYPVYLTIGNIPKDIRRKPSRHAHILLAYLPTTKLKNISNVAQRRRILSNIVHACLGYVLKPLESVGEHGKVFTSGDGVQRHCYPIVAIHGGNYMEQILIVGCKMMECVIDWP